MPTTINKSASQVIDVASVAHVAHLSLLSTPLMIRLLCLICVFFLHSQCGKRITVRDIKGAEKIYGLSFSRKEIKTMRNYLNDNRSGYDSLRKFPLLTSTNPALDFDPRPAAFAYRSTQDGNDWKLPDEIKLPDDDTAIAFKTVAGLSYLLRTRAITSTRLTTIYLSRLEKFGDTLKAVVTITEDLALKQAAKADEELARGEYRGPLHGIPYGIKDLFAVKDYKTTWGAEPYQSQVIDENAEVVQLLQQTGAVLVAKLTTGALARGDVWFGGKTKNPWDLKQGASGSSAGSASATSAGLVAFAIGTETLGSIIAPSTRCGVTGLRPTYGSVSKKGAMVLSWTMDKVGPICRSAPDCAIVYNVIRESTLPKMSFAPPKDLSGYKIGYFKHLFDKDTTSTGSNNDTTLVKLRALGAQLQEIKMPTGIPYDGFDVILRAESGAFFDELVRTHADRQMSEQGRSSRANSLRQSRFIPAVEYIQANRHREVLIEKFNEMMAGYDFIISPTNGQNQLLATNLTGHPAIAIPNGFDKKGRPTSITLIGHLYDEGTILEAAYLFQQATGFDEQHPGVFARKQ